MWIAAFMVVVGACAINTKDSAVTFYMDFERPNLSYYNPKFYSFMNVTARRHSRRDPIHYVSLHSHCLTSFGNEIQVDVYIYEFLSNEYRRSFLEVHYKLCEWMQKDKVVLPYLLKFLPIKICPFPKGIYRYMDMALPDVPLLKTFPFQKGRLFINASNWQSGERVVEGHVDVLIKQRLQ